MKEKIIEIHLIFILGKKHLGPVNYFKSRNNINQINQDKYCHISLIVIP